MIVPGASDPPISGLKTCVGVLGTRIGGLFGLTSPVINTDPEVRPGSLAWPVIVTWEETDRGVHVPTNVPETLSTGVRTSGGSPLENVATTCAAGTRDPQSSSTFTASGVGQPAGWAKLLTSPVCVATNLD